MAKPVQEEVEIGRLAPNPWNTNHMTPENEAKLDESLKRFGLYKPIVVRTLSDSTLQIIGGEHRWKAAKRLGMERVPVVNLGTISDRKAKEIGLADNGRYGEDDTLQLSELLRELGIEDISLFLPFSQQELDNIFAATSIALEDLEIDQDSQLPDLPSTPSAPTHQIMRFKVPVEDVANIQAVIEHVMKSEGFTKEDSMTNAGNALVSVVTKVRNIL